LAEKGILVEREMPQNEGPPVRARIPGRTAEELATVHSAVQPRERPESPGADKSQQDYGPHWE
jgi:hypothetical protein